MRVKEPKCHILGYDFGSQTFGVVRLPVGLGFTDESAKQRFFYDALPKLFKLHDDNMRQVVCVCLCTEAWLRLMPEGTDPDNTPENWREIATKTMDVITISFETADFSITTHWEILIKQAGKNTVKGLADPIVMDGRKDGNESKGRMCEVFRRYNRMKFFN